MSSRLPSSFEGNKDFYSESRSDKIFRRLKEEPLVPFGCALTCFALYRASQSMRAGTPYQTNKFFRQRIYAQAFTLVAIYVGSLYYAEDRKKRKEVEGIVSETKAAEKRDAWIRELEIRDQENKEEEARKEKFREEIRSREAQGGDAKAAAVMAQAKEAKSILESVESRGGVLDAVRALGGWR